MLPHLWSLHLYRYPATLRLGDRRFPIRPGYAGIVPPGTAMEYAFRGVSEHLFVHFRCVAPASQTAVPLYIPAMQDLGDEFARRYEALAEMVGDVHRPPYRVRAHIWDLLGVLTTPVPPTVAHSHPAVRYALRQIELRLAEALSVSALAREAKVSYSYLGRLFQQALGTTVVGYIRERRLRRAEHLLRHSTLPIKTIAATVGIPDLHLFNKSLRRSLGQSPTAVRAQGPVREGSTNRCYASDLGRDR